MHREYSRGCSLEGYLCCVFVTEARSFMPFLVHDLVPMTRVLCDACLGVIELAHPDTKPTLKANYRAAFCSVGARRDALAPEELNAQRHLWAYLFKVITTSLFINIRPII